MAETPRPSKPTGDPRVLRALAHPVRNRILDELSASGPLRAADVAEDLGIPANQASFHLRSLAKYGLVEEDTEAARDRRDRVWRLTQQEGWSIDQPACWVSRHTRSRRSRAASVSSSTRPYFASERRWKLAWLAGIPRSSATSAARSGPLALSSSRIRLRTGWASARRTRGSPVGLEGW